MTNTQPTIELLDETIKELEKTEKHHITNLALVQSKLASHRAVKLSLTEQAEKSQELTHP